MPQKSLLSDLLLPDQPIHELLMNEIQQHGKATALVNATDASDTLTYSDVIGQSRRLASALYGHGVRKGAVVSLVLPNCLQYPVIQLAVWQLGAICSTVNHLYTEYELHHHLQDSHASIVFTTPEAAHNVENVDRALGGQIEQIIILSKKAAAAPKGSSVKTVTFNGYIASGDDSKHLPYVDIDTADIAFLPYSSGTTGLPKGVQLSHRALVNMIHVFRDSRMLLLPQKGDTTPIFLPMFHLFGFMVVHISLAMGVKLVVMDKYYKPDFLRSIQKYKTKHVYLVPPVLVALAKDVDVDDYDLSSLQSVFVASAPIGQDLSEELMRRHPNIKYLMQGYGMTEIGYSHLMPPTPKDRLKHGSCGMLTANFQCKVVDLETSRELGANERGELWVKSPGVMTGYLKKPKATADTIDSDDWLHTGDICYYDTDGHYFVVDRLKELIKVKGFQVAPAELEDVLLSHEAVGDAAVIGVADERAGQLPRAYVVLKHTHAATPAHVVREHLHTFVNAKVAPYKRLKGGIEFLTAIPKSPSGKLLRRLLKDAPNTSSQSQTPSKPSKL